MSKNKDAHAQPAPSERRDRNQWLAALRSNSSELELDLAGHSALTSSWKIGPRKMRHLFIFYVEKGEAIGQVGGKAAHLRPGSLLWANLQTPHYFHPFKNCPAPTCYHLRFRVLEGDQSLGFGRSHFLIHDAHRYHWLLQEIHHNMNHPHEMQDIRLKCLYLYLYSELEQLSAPQKNTPRKLNPAICRKIVQFVQEQDYRDVSPSQLAAIAGFSPDYFSRIFRRTFHVAPRQWLLQERLKQGAMCLLHSPQLTVTEVAEHLGYCDVFLFSRQFKKVMGYSPSSYRELYG